MASAFRIGTLVLFAVGLRATAADKIDFTRDVRPLLSDACFSCHGPDEKHRKAKLRLDTKEGARSVLVPGKPDDSELYRRIVAEDSQLMPPKKSGKVLKPEHRAVLRKWIEQGAEYSAHWAFVAPVRSVVPRVAGVLRNPIDAFVLARLEKAGLSPSREAERVALIRRLHLDLTGLPPTVEEAEAALHDPGPDWYERRVDQLLASPHHGERWARHWLDGARYADSDGYEKDKPRFVWSYRDWVVNALNRDLPYDQFVVQQLAGDLLPDATQDQVVATGFLRNSMINEEGGVDPEQFRMEAMFDRMDALGKSVLGLTIQCAQCHNHKYDPLAQADYYRMFAFLNDTHEANVAVYTPAEMQKRSDILRKIQDLEAQLRHKEPAWKERLERWEKRVNRQLPTWVHLRPPDDELTTGGEKYYLRDDGAILAQGYAPTKHRVRFTMQTTLPKIAAIRLEMLNDPNLPLGGPGRSIKGTAALSEIEVETAPLDQPTKKVKVKFAHATSDFEPPERPNDAIYDDRSGQKRVTGPIAYAVDGRNDTAWTTDAGPGRRNQERKAVFTLDKPIENTKGTVLTITLVQLHGGWNSDDNQNHNLGCFRLSVSADEDAVADPLPARVRASLVAKRTPAQDAIVFSYWRTTVPEWLHQNRQIEELWQEHPEGASQLVLKARSKARMTHVLERGDFLKPKDAVGPGVPAFLHALPADAKPDRLTFARWLVDRRSPTTARAIVNRVWQHYFGTGLVSTSEDFGVQGEAPSHPELLDWLAVEFMESGWSLKQLHRLIVGSATYRQSSRVTPMLHDRDPDNRLLARGPRFRVEGEVVRDVALAASGLLNPRLGGASVQPDAPAFLFVPPASYGPKVWKADAGEDRYRRALYTFRFRSVPYPVMQTFDAPNGDFSCVRRVRSNTPLQALTTLNEPIFLEAARALALKTLQEKRTDEERLTFAFRRCVARPPAQEERRILLELLKRQTERFSQTGAEPWQLAAADPKSPPTLPGGVTPAQAAAWTAVARVLLNLDETITKE